MLTIKPSMLRNAMLAGNKAMHVDYRKHALVTKNPTAVANALVLEFKFKGMSGALSLGKTYGLDGRIVRGFLISANLL